MAGDRFCFDLLHVKTGTWIIAIVQIVWVIIGLINSIRGLIQDTGHHEQKNWEIAGGFIGSIVFLSIFLIFIIILMVALYKNRAKLVLPHLILSVVLIVWIIVNIVLIILGGTKFWNIVYLALFALFLVSCLFIEWLTYKYLSGFTY